MDSDDSEDSV